LLVLVVHQAAGELPSLWRSLKLLQRLLGLENMIWPSRSVELEYELSNVSLPFHVEEIEIRS
jgi:hypothetical protein